jgi:hypothetical protein
MIYAIKPWEPLKYTMPNKYNTTQLIRALARDIDDQIDALKDYGLTAASIVLSLDAYTALIQYLAHMEGTEEIEARAKYRDCTLVIVTTEGVAEVVPSAPDAWENGDAFLGAKGIGGTSRPTSDAEDYGADGGEAFADVL